MISFGFLARNWRLLGFGLAMCFLSGAGQTFFISLFGGEVRSTFGLSHGEFGSLYSIATIASAGVLMWAGGLIDRVPLARYATVVLAGLAGACLVLYSAPGLAVLGVAIFGLRFFGQGLASHAAITAMARYFDAARGRAVAVASLGHTLGEAVLPPVIVAALAFGPWRNGWLGAALVLVACVPLVRWLLRGATVADRPASADARPAPVDRTRGEVLRDRGLWLRLPALMAPSFIYTGLIFHQIHIASEKGWTLSALASAYTLYAAIAVATSIGAGILVDRVGATRLVPVFLAPLALACAALASLDGTAGVFAFMGLLGVSTGITLIMLGALWAELYGTRHLGAIKAFAQAVMVFSTGLAPGAMGLLMDAGFGIASIATACGVYCVCASILSGLARRVRHLKTASRSAQ